MKVNSIYKHNSARITTGLVIAVALLLGQGATADISSVKQGKGDMHVKSMPRLVSAADVKSRDVGQYLRCWQNGRLIIESTGWSYVPSGQQAKQQSWLFGTGGRATKRLFVDGETTCLYSDEDGVK